MSLLWWFLLQLMREINPKSYTRQHTLYPLNWGFQNRVWSHKGPQLVWCACACLFYQQYNITPNIFPHSINVALWVKTKIFSCLYILVRLTFTTVSWAQKRCKPLVYIIMNHFLQASCWVMIFSNFIIMQVTKPSLSCLYIYHLDTGFEFKSDWAPHLLYM